MQRNDISQSSDFPSSHSLLCNKPKFVERLKYNGKQFKQLLEIDEWETFLNRVEWKDIANSQRVDILKFYPADWGSLMDYIYVQQQVEPYYL